MMNVRTIFLSCLFILFFPFLATNAYSSEIFGWWKINGGDSPIKILKFSQDTVIHGFTSSKNVKYENVKNKIFVHADSQYYFIVELVDKNNMTLLRPNSMQNTLHKLSYTRITDDEALGFFEQQSKPTGAKKITSTKDPF